MATGESGKQIYTSFSCQLCKNVDVPEMVQCDFCDLWFHFVCVDVASDVVDREWTCERCNLLRESLRDFENEKCRRASKERSSVPDAFSYKSSRVSTLTARQKTAALNKLREEQEIKSESKVSDFGLQCK